MLARMGGTFNTCVKLLFFHASIEDLPSEVELCSWHRYIMLLLISQMARTCENEFYAPRVSRAKKQNCRREQWPRTYLV